MFKWFLVRPFIAIAMNPTYESCFLNTSNLFKVCMGLTYKCSFETTWIIYCPQSFIMANIILGLNQSLFTSWKMIEYLKKVLKLIYSHEKLEFIFLKLVQFEFFKDDFRKVCNLKDLILVLKCFKTFTVLILSWDIIPL